MLATMRPFIIGASCGQERMHSPLSKKRVSQEFPAAGLAIPMTTYVSQLASYLFRLSLIDLDRPTTAVILFLCKTIVIFLLISVIVLCLHNATLGGKKKVGSK